MPYLSLLLLPLFAALAAVFVRHAKLRDISQILLAFLAVREVVTMLPSFVHGTLGTLTLAEPVPGIALRFSVDGFGLIFLLTVSVLWAVSLVYCTGYLRAAKEKNQPRFYAWFNLAIAATVGVAMSGNLFTLFLFYELLTLTTFPLVTHSGTKEARGAGRTYLFLLLGTSALLLAAIVGTYALTGSAEFTRGGLFTGISPAITGLFLFLYMYGLGKAALMPVHRWLPAAMVAPVPVSALLHAVAVVKAGVFAALKIVVMVFGIEHLRVAAEASMWGGGWFLWVAGGTMVLASITALKQDNLKKLLAYSTIGQLAFVLLALSLFTPVGVLAAAFHIAAHAFGKITLFFAAGAIYTASGKTEISQMAGLGRRMPWTFAALTIGALSMIGLPPAAGFLSKYILLQGAFYAQHWELILLISFSTLLNAAYFLPLLFTAFFGKATGKKHGEAPLACVAALVLTAALTLLLFLWPDIIINLAGRALKGGV